jgi:hypothetical protein
MDSTGRQVNSAIMGGMDTKRLFALMGVAVMGIALLSGCYIVNQPRFEASIHKRASVGMPLQAAVAALGERKMHCNGENPVDCSRLRQSLMPYSCVERVHLYSSGPDRLVTEIQIPKIACAGL